jgi:hypothetical protein
MINNNQRFWFDDKLLLPKTAVKIIAALGSSSDKSAKRIILSVNSKTRELINLA